MTAIAGKQTIELDGRKIEYALHGAGRPAIVFISGGGPLEMDSWGEVFRGLEGAGTLIAYNRFGDGNSSRVRAPQTGPSIVATLRELLRRLALHPPYLLVGHSVGGVFANLFARLHPNEVAGAVLVDPTYPDQGRVMRAQSRNIAGRLVRRTYYRLGMKLYAFINPSKASEFVWVRNASKALEEAGSFPDIPLVVITAGKRTLSAWFAPALVEAIDRYQLGLAAVSSHGRRIIAPESGHFVPRDAPQIVIDAIRDVVAQIRDTGR